MSENESSKSVSGHRNAFFVNISIDLKLLKRKESFIFVFQKPAFENLLLLKA